MYLAALWLFDWFQVYINASSVVELYNALVLTVLNMLRIYKSITTSIVCFCMYVYGVYVWSTCLDVWTSFIYPFRLVY